jgi:hypothetical protein
MSSYLSDTTATHLLRFLEPTRELLREVEVALPQKLLCERVLDARLRCDRLIEQLKQPPATN